MDLGIKEGAQLLKVSMDFSRGYSTTRTRGSLYGTRASTPVRGVFAFEGGRLDDVE